MRSGNRPEAGRRTEVFKRDDPNAIRVEADGVLIGYVPKAKTKHVRELLASGRVRFVDVEIKGGKYKVAYEDGDLQRGEYDFNAALILKIEEAPKT